MAASKEFKSEKGDWFDGKWKDMKRPEQDKRRGADTGYPLKDLQEIGKVLCTVPEGFNVHKTLKRTLNAKEKMFETGKGFDWGTAEALAYGSIIKEGHRVRLCGQDSQRGTFSHRHSVFIDQETEETYAPLQNLSDSGDHHADYEVIDSALSEEAVLGFEDGYSLAEPDALVIWEAQFGDFANGAQMVFDQFIATSESKWARMTGLVMLLPHGYEGQGPEHSSARLERFLQLCGEDNMQVANCTTPANFFHIMRRQLKRNFRKPLVIMSPKSLLRHKLATSKLEEMAEGTEFHRVLWDNAQSDPDTSIQINKDKDIKRVVFCSGKVYFELLAERDKRKQKDTYLVRVEQVYPYPDAPVEEIMARFSNAETIVWCQEEPRNMGAWDFIAENIERSLINVGCKMTRPIYAGRKRSASPATGLMARHLIEQAALIDEALTVK
jgi:2-oxoglutarate dehydrogenase E1 component